MHTLLLRRLRSAVLVALWGVAIAVPAAAGSSAKSTRDRDLQPNLEGHWSIDPRPGRTYHFSLRIELRPESQHWQSHRVRAADLEAWGAGDVSGAPQDLNFRIRRDAGTFVCEGRAGNGRGAGVFRLELSPGFASELRRRGVGAPTPYEQAELALVDGVLELLDEVQRRGAEVALEDLIRMGHHGVDLAYVRGMARWGIATGDVDQLVKLRDHGVDPTFIEGMASAGYRNLAVEELLRARDHGADPQYARAMEKAGFGGLALDDLVRARDHGVDAEYVAGMRRAGYADVDLETLIRARDHGVDSEFARRARARLGRAPSLERLIEMRDRGELDG